MQSAVVVLLLSPRPVFAAKVDQAAASVVRDRAQRVEAVKMNLGLAPEARTQNIGFLIYNFSLTEPGILELEPVLSTALKICLPGSKCSFSLPHSLGNAEVSRRP